MYRLTIILLAILLWWHADASFAAVPAKQVGTLIILKNDLVRPDNGESVAQQTTTMFWSYGRLGMAFDASVQRSSRYQDFAPYALFQIKPFYSLAGYSTASSGDEYLFAGAWYLNKHRGINVFADVRNYFGTKKQSASFFDSFLEMAGSPSRKTWLAFDVVYDYWWNTKSRQFLLMGPAVGVYVAKPVLLFTRVSREWSWGSGAKIQAANRFRLGLRLIF